MSDCPPWDGEIDSNDNRFVQAQRTVRQDISKRCQQSLIESKDLRRWHRTLFSSFVPLDYYAGYYRQNDLDRPCLGIDVHIANITGAPFKIVHECMNRLIDNFRNHLIHFELAWVRLTPQERAFRTATLLARAIGEFIRIHPFLQGNGRTSRCLWIWGLSRFNIPIQVGIAPRPNQPYSEIMARSMHGDDKPLMDCIFLHLLGNRPQQMTQS